MKILLSLAGLALLSAVGMSATIYVPDNYPTIQGAIDASSNGDVIIVRPGTYVENIDFVGKAIHLQSEQGAAATTIDGNQSSCVVLFNNGEDKDSILEGFAITNGIGFLKTSVERVGGGICCISASPVIVSNTVNKNDASEGGGGIYCQFATPEIINNTISENTSYRGGGVYCDELSHLTFTKNTIMNNSAYKTGAVRIYSSSSVMIYDNHIENNYADRDGGISYRKSDGVIENNTLVDNNNNSSCGQVDVYDCDSMVTINNNHIFMTSVQSITKGIDCESSLTIISNNVIHGHGASQGGGIKMMGGSPLVVSNVIYNNTAEFEGGGIYCEKVEEPIIVNNTIARNTASRGGGISTEWYSSPTIANNVIINNTATEYGGGIHNYNVITVEHITVVNTVSWGNDAPQGPEIAAMGLVSVFFVAYSDIAGGPSAAYIEGNCSLFWGAGNIDADPLFSDPSNNDFHLTWDSPCRDAGDNSVVIELFDFENDPRIVGGTVDIGADEFYYHLYHIGDVIPGGNVDLRVIGYPQAPVTLAWGQTILEPPHSTQHGNLYIWPFVWSGFIGNVQSNGVLSMPVTIPSTWQPGDHAPLQALVGPWGGGWAKLTNLDVVTVE